MTITRRIFYIFLLQFFIQYAIGQSEFYPIGMESEHYICYHTEAPIVIDGIANDASWDKAKWTSDFVDIEGHLQELPHLDTRVKMLWDDTYFYLYAEMEEPHVWGTLTERDAVIFLDDDFEIFIDPDQDGVNYYELEVNALETLWELILLRTYRNDHRPKVLNNWNLSNIKVKVNIDGTINDPSDEDIGWSVEWAIPFSALSELADFKKHPIDGDQWKVNFSRVDWKMDIEDGVYKKRKDESTNKALPESNWVWSPIGKINMHIPEMWGIVQFSTYPTGDAAEVTYVEDTNHDVKAYLWNLYQGQLKRKNNGMPYTDVVSELSYSEIGVPDNIDIHITVTPDYFEIRSSHSGEMGDWVINSNGRIFYSKN